MTDLYIYRPQGGGVRRCLHGNLMIARREAELGQEVLQDGNLLFHEAEADMAAVE